MIRTESFAYCHRLCHFHREITVFCIVSLAVAMCIPPWPWCLVYLSSIWGLAVVGARIPFLLLIRLIALPSVFLLFSSATLCLGLHLHADGFEVRWIRSEIPSAIRTSLRSFTALSEMILLTILVPLPVILSQLTRFRIPNFVIEFIVLVYRMIFLLEHSRATITRAQNFRLGFSDIRKSFRSLVYLASSLFVKAYHRGHRLQLGLESRGYTDSVHFHFNPHGIRHSAFMIPAFVLPLFIGALAFWWRTL